MFPGVRTGEKPQSKLVHHDGSWWTVLHGPGGLALYEKIGNVWAQRTFLGGSGKSDLKLSGSKLYVLVFETSPRFFELTYDAPSRSWVLDSGYPVQVPAIPGSESLVLEEDSTGRLWYTGEGSGQIVAYFTLASHQDWSNIPVILQTGVDDDDIASVVAFGGNKICVFWSDLNTDAFGFRVHDDSDAPLDWGPHEVVYPGFRHADDHLNLAFDSSGRVYALTKDDNDFMAVHRREIDGTWSTSYNVLAGTGNHGIIMVSEADSTAYIVYTDWSVTPSRIAYRTAHLEDLIFGNTTPLLFSVASGLDDVSGTKQILPPGSLAAVARGGGNVWWNAFGDPGGAALPGAPQSLLVTALSSPARVEMAWSPPASGTPQSYHVYRSRNEGPVARLTFPPVTQATFTDGVPPDGTVCYAVSAVDGGVEGPLSEWVCVARGAPGAPSGLTVTADEIVVDPRHRTPHALESSSRSAPRGSAKAAADPQHSPSAAPDTPERITAGPPPTHRVVELEWQRPIFGLAPTRYTVYRSIDGAASVPVAVLPSTAKSHVDFDVPIGTLCYTVTASNGYGEGPPTAQECTSAFVSAPAGENASSGAFERRAGTAQCTACESCPRTRSARSRIPSIHTHEYASGCSRQRRSASTSTMSAGA